jgi:hypothetical protein
MIYRGPGFLAVVWFALPSVASRLDRRHTKRWEREETTCWREGEGMDEEPNHTTVRKPGLLLVIQYSLYSLILGLSFENCTSTCVTEKSDLSNWKEFSHGLETYGINSLTLTRYRKSDLCIPRNETARPCSPFLHSCICYWCAYCPQQRARPIEGIYKSLTDTCMWKLGDKTL